MHEYIETKMSEIGSGKKKAGVNDKVPFPS